MLVFVKQFGQKEVYPLNSTHYHSLMQSLICWLLVLQENQHIGLFFINLIVCSGIQVLKDYWRRFQQNIAFHSSKNVQIYQIVPTLLSLSSDLIFSLQSSPMLQQGQDYHIFSNQAMKKLLKSKLNSEQQFDSKTIQHLQHDFMVQQCLKDSSQFSNNSQAYIGLLNQVSFRNRSKRKHIEVLSRQARTISSPARDPVSEDVRFSRVMPPQQQLITFQKKILEEEEIRSHLLTEMTQISKSINLQRGDVSRMIAKNESTNVLEKKTNKVRNIAMDQLKKVSSALSKDHAEIQERNLMQIKFNKKLRNISNNETGILTKIKSDFCKIEKRKNTIFSKINKMEDIIKTLDQHEKNGEEINVMKEKNKMNIMELINLMNLIKEVNQTNNQLYHQEDDKRQKETQVIVDQLLQSDIDTFIQSLTQVENYVISSIKDQMTKIDQSNENYNYSTEKLEEKKSKLKEVEKECAELQQLLYTNNKERFSISAKEKQMYCTKLNEFETRIKLLFIIWGFVENHAVFTSRINQINQCQQSELTKQRRQQNSMISRFYRKSEQFQKNTMVTQEENRYISRLHALYVYLDRGTQDIDLSQQYIFKQLEMNIILWLKGLKNLILEGRKIKQHLRHEKKPKSLECWKIRSSYNLQDQPAKETIPKQFRNSQSEENEDKLKTMLDFIIPKKSMLFSNSDSSNNTHLSRFRKTEGDEDNYKPERVKFIHKIDQDYYKMIKNVLQIEKENIKKNYDFSKTFNRSKYTQKNILQEEKRYQSTFALEFIRKNEKIIEKQFSQKSESPRDSVKEEINRKRRPFHHHTEYVTNFNAEEKSPSVSNFKPQKKPESNLKKSAFNKTLPNVKLLQRHSLATQPTQNDEKPKTIRTSVLNLKRSVINFLEPDGPK